RVIPKLSYRACSALAHLGGRVLHARCVDLAAAYRVPLTVRSSFDDSPGTEIEEEVMEGAREEAVTHRDDCSIAIAEGNAGGRGARLPRPRGALRGSRVGAPRSVSRAAARRIEGMSGAKAGSEPVSASVLPRSRLGTRSMHCSGQAWQPGPSRAILPPFVGGR